MTEKNITREAIVQMGDTILSHKDVEQVTIKISFRDCGEINYTKHEEEMDLEVEDER